MSALMIYCTINNIMVILIMTWEEKTTVEVQQIRPALVAEWVKPLATVHTGQGSLPVRVEA